MREGCFEVLLVHGEGAHEVSFDEFILNNGHIYASCEPGLEYTVKVNIYRDPRTGRFPANCLRVGLYCDGMDVKYWKRLDMSNPDKLPHYVTAKFMGFKKSSQDLRAFVFSTPAIDSHNQTSAPIKGNDKQLGQIKVVFHEAVLIGGVFDNNTSVNEVPTAPDLISENKKFWEQASITTTAGRKITNQKEVFVPLIKWANTSHEPCKTLLLYYHSRQVIEFLQSMENNNSNNNRKEKRKSVTSAVTNDDDDDNNDDNDEIEVHQPAKIAHILDLTNSDDENEASTRTWETIVINPQL